MILWIGAISQGLGYAFLALGVYLSFKILNFPDMTVDGSLVTGAAITGILLIKGVHPVWCIFFAVISGSIAGMITGLIHTKLKINPLLSGILMMTGLYSINLHIMGRSNLPLLREKTILTIINDLKLPFSKDISTMILFFILVLLIRFVIVWFLRTDLGLAFRATGDNPEMITAQGVNTDFTKILGLAIANGLVALSGSLITQYQGFADVGMGIGMLVAGIASVVIGETISPKKRINYLVTFVIFGSVIFRLLIALALQAGLNPIDLKLITAIFVLTALALPQIRKVIKPLLNKLSARKI
ncbi:MAG: ABC transporter permease [Candidatus Cloacimonetes bacterium]|nr:ABC transporter permease [Candidatus Cloacimonadota bacterium]